MKTKIMTDTRNSYRTLLKSLVILCYLLPCISFAQESFLSQQNLSRLQQLIDSPSRSEDARARNQYRNPLPTLDFFDVRPELTVVEIWPGGPGGWYRSILAPYIEGSGTYIPVRADDTESPFVGVVADNTADRVLGVRAHGLLIYDYPGQAYYYSLYPLLKPGRTL